MLWLLNSSTRLLSNEWRGFKRSPMLGANVGTTIIIGIFILYFALSFVALAVVSKSIIGSTYPDAVFIEVVFAFLLLYFLVDVLSRFFLQKYTSVELRPYLTLPIKKSVITDYFLLRSLSSYFNYLPLFFAIPLYFVHLTGESGIVQINFCLFIIGAIIFNNYLVFWINKFLKVNSWMPAVVLITIVTLLFLGYKEIIPLMSWMTFTGKSMLSNTVLTGIPLVLGLGLGIYSFLRKNISNDLALTEGKGTGQRVVLNPSFGFHRYFGAAGYIMDLEIKLIMRSKRARTLFITGLFFVFYPLIRNEQEFMFFDLTYALLGTGSILFSYGQLMLSWNSLHFDLLQTRILSIRDIFLGKYYLLVICCLFMTILMLPYIFMSVKFGLLVLVMGAFNMSFSIFMYMFLASYNSKKIDPTEGAFFNYGGLGAGHYLIVIPLFVVPFLLYALGSWLGEFPGGILAIALPSLLLLIFHKQAINFCYKNFLKHRYKITAAFRTK